MRTKRSEAEAIGNKDDYETLERTTELDDEANWEVRRKFVKIPRQPGSLRKYHLTI